MGVAEALWIGGGLGLSIAAAPGPVLALCAIETSRGRWRTGLAVGFGAVAVDVLMFSLVLLGLAELSPSDVAFGVLAMVGVGVMAWLGFDAWRAAGRPLRASAPAGGSFAGPPLDRLRSQAIGFGRGFLLAATSPIVYAWWVSGGAPFLHRYGMSLAVGFFGAVVAWTVFAVALFWWLSRRIPKFERYVGYVSAVALWTFAALLAANALALLA